ncbi:hypothetical protein P4O66_021327, partial [Electrophorus voltai]
ELEAIAGYKKLQVKFMRAVTMGTEGIDLILHGFSFCCVPPFKSSKTPTTEGCPGRKNGKGRREANVLPQLVQVPRVWGCPLDSRIGERGPGECDTGAEAGVSHDTTSDYRDWYNDFQSSESDDRECCDPQERPSFILASLHGLAAGEGPAAFYRDQLAHEDGYSEEESAGSYLEFTEGYVEYEERGGCSDVTLELDRGSDREEDLVMEVEGVPREELPSADDFTRSEDNEITAPNAPPKALPRARRSGAGKQPLVTTRAQAPTPKLRGGKRTSAPGTASQIGNTAGTLPHVHAPGSGQPPPTELAMNTAPQADIALVTASPEGSLLLTSQAAAWISGCWGEDHDRSSQPHQRRKRKKQTAPAKEGNHPGISCGEPSATEPGPMGSPCDSCPVEDVAVTGSRSASDTVKSAVDHRLSFGPVRPYWASPWERHGLCLSPSLVERAPLMVAPSLPCFLKHLTTLRWLHSAFDTEKRSGPNHNLYACSDDVEHSSMGKKVALQRHGWTQRHKSYVWQDNGAMAPICPSSVQHLSGNTFATLPPSGNRVMHPPVPRRPTVPSGIFPSPHAHKAILETSLPYPAVACHHCYINSHKHRTNMELYFDSDTTKVEAGYFFGPNS